MNTYNIVCPNKVVKEKLLERLEILSEYEFDGAFVVQDGSQITFRLKDEEYALVFNIEDELAPEGGWAKYEENLTEDTPEPELLVVNTGNVIEWGNYGGSTALMDWVQRYTVEALATYFNGTVDYGNGARPPKKVPADFMKWYNKQADDIKKLTCFYFWEFDVPRFSKHQYWDSLIEELKPQLPKNTDQ